MTSRTGNKAFTLIEIMAATAVLSLGVVFMYEAFLTSLNAYGYYTSYLRVSPFMDQKIWEAQDNLRRLNSIGEMPQEGVFDSGSRAYKWSLSYEPQGSAENLYKIGLLVSWQQGKKDLQLVRAAYAEFEQQEKK